MKSYSIQKCEINLRFRKKNILIKFQEPTLEKMCIFNELIGEKKEYEAFNLIVGKKFLFFNKISKKDFRKNPHGILSGVIVSIFGDSKISNSNKDTFYNASIDFVCQRYGIHPVEYQRKTYISQHRKIFKGIEWNLNIDTGNQAKNFQILLEEGKIDEELEAIKRIKDRFKKN